MKEDSTPLCIDDLCAQKQFVCPKAFSLSHAAVYNKGLRVNTKIIAAVGGIDF